MAVDIVSVNCLRRAVCFSQHRLLLRLDDNVKKELGFTDFRLHGEDRAQCRLFCLSVCEADRGKITWNWGKKETKPHISTWLGEERQQDKSGGPFSSTHALVTDLQ